MNEDIKQALDVLYAGGLILYPTDTIWGIGCDATNEEAVKKVYELKKRVDSKALITLVDNMSKVEFYVKDVPGIAWDLVEIADKPLTVIYDNARNLAPNLVAEDGSIAIRVTQEKFSQTLCQRFRKAIVSTSANISGEPSPQSFEDISEEIKNGVDYIVKFRQTEKTKSKPSSIIKLGTSGQVKIIRE
ncbi:L-threonylcarbamoyladenylate synthase [Dysgonomonas massiliensis]|uniref:L-threonylcarbamoyladenylate synthase n=1 Tax=Dysgonomonas massiliensis TaxID=2040292 RepID=UPI000C78B8B9|nr:L-threonylcarbamoyladenylate synthase [Dysgonomonas massiliensis]